MHKLKPGHVWMVAVLLALTAFSLDGRVLASPQNAPKHHRPARLLPIAVAHIPPRLYSSAGACLTYGTGCRVYQMALMNAERGAIGVPPLALDLNLSRGVGCVGAYGHARANGLSGSLWHISPYPQYAYANFNIDMQPCIGPVPQGQIIGEGYGGEGKKASIDTVNQLMMQEPHDAAYCAVYSNHACSILSRLYRRAGVGFYRAAGVWFVVVDLYG